jgi:hypothetical protein
MVKPHYIVQSTVGSTLSHTRSFSSTSVRRMDPINTTILSITVSVDPIVFSLLFMTGLLGFVFLSTFTYTQDSAMEISPPLSFSYLLPLFEVHYEFTRSMGDLLHYLHANINNLNEEQLIMLSFYLPHIISGGANVSVLLDFWSTVAQPIDVIDDIHALDEDIRSIMNNSVDLLRMVEIRLDIPENARISSTFLL